MKTSKEEFEKLLDTTLSFDGSYKHEFVYINEDLEFRGYADYRSDFDKAMTLRKLIQEVNEDWGLRIKGEQYCEEDFSSYLQEGKP